MSLRLLVVGAGQMGSGIAQSAAQHDFEVFLWDSLSQQTEKALQQIRARLDRAVQKGEMDSSQADAIMDRIDVPHDLGSVPSVDLVVEAIIEQEKEKVSLFEQLGRLFDASTILASNTSSISISRIARPVPHPERVIGMHFMNPVPVMRLVEVVAGTLTSQDTVQKVVKWAEMMEKTPVVVQDYPGFVSNRILMPMINEAIFALQEGVASKEAIDTVMKLGMNHPMGPLTLADFIGLDTCLAIMEVLYEGFADSKYRPAPLLRKMVDAGLLGRKSGRGFYDYEKA
ncbi:MAG: 3-hydroxybutyryl-CoA dehydrogenase [Sulfobacillus thermosulfidooxidans]|uniref:3-hydroxybutyryl-CoA dehydrogenase n=1 Tax=Sulfobacillus thermosulfidooxidans TaxID=28034 RepID=A0A2T2X152_SULTH|nr:3-hydroxyacyl-CoA dehydrogenase NAD-binding domain-containing protein [Sulfobacillus thermosulfidooxidans]PSR28202.1 MAG: 3-hydroxybutyryl-CoA dehydrogenase [Sulfobacillus thermosulfidooxidans]